MIKRIIPKLIFVAIVLFIFIPFAAIADDYDGDTGIVGCAGIKCDFCDFLAMIKTIIDTAVGFSFLIGSALAATGGVWMIIAGAAEGIQKGKDILIKALIGLLIILGAWLIVNITILTIIPDDAKGDGPLGGWFWFNVDCEAIQEKVLEIPGNIDLEDEG